VTHNDPSPPNGGDDARAAREGVVVTAHIGLLMTALFALFALVKVLSVAHYDSTTALALLRSSSTVVVILGTLLLIIPSVLTMTVAAVIAAVDRGIGSKEDEMVLILLGYVSCFLLGLVSLLAGVVLLLFLILFCHSWLGRFILKFNKDVKQWEAQAQARNESLDQLKEAVKASSGEEKTRLAVEGLSLLEEARADLKRRREHMAPGRERTKRITLMFAAVLLFGSLWAATRDRPWLPAEVIHLSGEAPMVGYVVKEDERGLVVLREQDRTIVDIPSGSETKRSLCRLNPPTSASVPLHRVLGQSTPTYELCSESAD
jgi:hypothetical protein